MCYNVALIFDVLGFQSPMDTLLIYFMAFLSTVIFIYGYIYIATSKEIVDIPNERSSHIGKIPRGAGLILFSVWLLFYYLLDAPLPNFLYIFPSLSVITLLGFLDDLKDLPSKLRFVIQIICATQFIYVLGLITNLQLGTYLTVPFLQFATPFLIISVAWSINLFNFMDGIDGIAAIEAIYFFSVGALIHFMNGSYDWFLMSCLIISILFGFLLFNWPRAKIFMGDSGSYFLGFSIAVYSIVSTVYYDIPLFIWLIIYGVFWFDATVTLFRRVFLKESWHSPHNSHAYQRLQVVGWTHRDILSGVVFINTILSFFAVLSYFLSLVEWAFGISLCLLTCIYVFIERLIPMSRSKNS